MPLHRSFKQGIQSSMKNGRLIELRFFFVPSDTRHKIGHFGDVLPIKSLGLVLKN